MCSMHSTLDQAKNEDKHLISQVSSISNYSDTVSLTTNNESRGLGSEYGGHLASVVVSSVNIISHTIIINPKLKIDFESYFFEPFYYFISEVDNICNSSAECSCNCSCNTSCNGEFICLCLCNPDGAGTHNDYCLCVCKKSGSSNCKCLCICICQNQEKCCCGAGAHQCKQCLVKVDIGTLKLQSYGILYVLKPIRCCMCKLEKELTSNNTCFCCGNLCCKNEKCKSCNCDKCCCKDCQIDYRSILSNVHVVIKLFNELKTKITKLQKLKNVLSFYATFAKSCSCPTGCCNDKIKKLIDHGEKGITYYSLFASRLYRLKYKLEYIYFLKISVCLNLKNLLTNHAKTKSLNKQEISKSTITIYYNLLSCFSNLTIKDSYFLSFYLKPMIDNMKENLETLKPVYNCYCVYSFKRKNDQSCLRTSSTSLNFSELSIKCKNIIDNRENYLCLCLVIKYRLIPCILKCSYKILNIYYETSITYDRKHYKYNQNQTLIWDMSKLIFLVLGMIEKIVIIMERKYILESRNKDLNRSNVQKRENKLFLGITMSKNLMYLEHFGYKIGMMYIKYLRDLLICFCNFPEDQYYPYLISIILYLSSLIENIWAMDHHAIVTAIQSLSSLLSEYQSIHVYTNYSSESRCRIYPLIVNKPCGDPATKKCCCWCVAIINLLVAYIYLCFQSKLCKALCKKEKCEKIKDFCTKEECKCTCKKSECCLLKLASSSELCNSEKVQKVLKTCCVDCAGEEGCCKKICQKVKSGGDLLVIGCKCDCNSKETEEVKAQCVFFNNPWGGRSAALVIACKCEDSTKCCLKNVIDKLKQKIGEICGEECKCEQIKTSLTDLCKDPGCCGEGQCQICTDLKDKLGKICNGEGNGCLCKKIEALKTLCTSPGNTCQCKKESCCRCVCCKLLVAGVRVLTRACKQNVLEPSKRIVIELLSGAQNKEELMRSIVNKINDVRQKQTFLVKNNYSTHFNTYTDHKNIENSFPRLTMGYGYDTVYEHQTKGNSGYTGINGIREDNPNSRCGRIIKRNELKLKERANVYTQELSTH